MSAVLRVPAHWLCAALLALNLAGAASAADIAVQDLDGERAGLTTRLERGKWNIVMAWTTYCSVCRAQYPLLSAFHQQHHATAAVVLGVSLDGFNALSKVAAYRSSSAHGFPSVVSSVEEFAPKYERITGETFTGTPSYLFVAPDGAVRAFFDGPVTQAILDQVIANRTR